MITPGALDLPAQRYTPFVATFDFVGYDLSGASFAFQLRGYRDAPDPPLVNLTTQTDKSVEGVSVTVVANAGIPTSTVQIFIAEATLRALALTNPRGGDLSLAWDIIITSATYGKLRWLQGAFVLAAGASQ